MTMPGRSHHLLSIGATGMLADAVIALSADTTRVTSVARTERSLDELDRMLVAAHHANGSLPVRRSLALDYRQQTAFRRSLAAEIATTPVDRALVWMHGAVTTNGVLPLATMLGRQREESPSDGPAEFWHVVGSAGGNLAALVGEYREECEKIEGITYRRIILGSIREESRRRWLTHDEISAGVVGLVSEGEGGVIGGGE